MREKIVYVRQTKDLLSMISGTGILHALKVQSMFMGRGFYARAGADVWPLKFQRDFWHQLMPVTVMPQPTAQDLDFAQCTDHVFKHLRATRWDRPWYVDWSGGIDSTVIVVALLRNLAPADLDNVIINLNAFSYWEHPDFYRDHIRPNFRCINTQQYDRDVRNCVHHYRVHGDPADMLWGAARSLQAKKDGIDLSRSWRDNDTAWQQFNRRLWGDQAARWIYRVMAQSIESVPQYGVETIADWYWWLNFNFKWVQKMVYDYAPADQPQQYFDNIVPWYADPVYQLWSINHGRFSLLNSSLDAYKSEAKDYIWSWDHNDLYRKFKLKFNSTGRPSSNECWAITDRLAYLDREQLMSNPQLMHDHLVDRQ